MRGERGWATETGHPGPRRGPRDPSQVDDPKVSRLRLWCRALRCWICGSHCGESCKPKCQLISLSRCNRCTSRSDMHMGRRAHGGQREVLAWALLALALCAGPARGCGTRAGARRAWLPALQLRGGAEGERDEGTLLEVCPRWPVCGLQEVVRQVTSRRRPAEKTRAAGGCRCLTSGLAALHRPTGCAARCRAWTMRRASGFIRSPRAIWRIASATTTGCRSSACACVL